jgi:hypothetical protein
LQNWTQASQVQHLRRNSEGRTSPRRNGLQNKSSSSRHRGTYRSSGRPPRRKHMSGLRERGNEVLLLCVDVHGEHLQHVLRKSLKPFCHTVAVLVDDVHLLLNRFLLLGLLPLPVSLKFFSIYLPNRSLAFSFRLSCPLSHLQAVKAPARA